MGRGRGERASPLDLSNLRVEEHGLPMHIAALAVLDGWPLLDAGGRLRLEELRRHVADRVRDVERLHQVLVWAHGRHRAPTWVTAPVFDVADHVLSRRVPPPGDEAALLALCSDLNAPPLDRSRPLWELWLLPGLAGGRVALLLRLHHVVADGAAALELFAALFDPSPEASPGPPAAPSRGPLVAVGRRLRRTWQLLRLGRAPALSWNRPVGTRRRHLLLRADFAAVRAAGRAHRGTVNDVVLAAVGGGAHRLLERRGELAPGLDLHVSVPASLRRPGQRGGNRVGVRPVAVPVSDPDVEDRLRSVAAWTARQRDWPPLQPAGRLLQRWAVHVMSRQRLINMVVSNLPGPRQPLELAGARVLELFQLSALQGNCAIGVGVLSYAGQLTVDVVGDPDVVPDLEVFAGGVAEALERLGAGLDVDDVQARTHRGPGGSRLPGPR